MGSFPGRLAARAYLRALHLLPPSSRDRYGEEMAAMFEEEWAQTRGLGRLRLVWRTLGDLLTAAFSMRWDRFRDVGGIGGTTGVMEDLHWVRKGLLRRPGFTGVVVLTLTLGVGVNVAIFSFVNGLLLRPLPYGEPARLVQLSETFPGLGTMDLALPDFHRWRSETRVFEGIFAFDDERFVLSASDQADFVEGAVVSPGFLSVLRVPLALGRDFSSEEETPGSDRVAILSHRLWESRFGGRSDILGSTVLLDGVERTVVGVAPRGFNFPEVADLWVPLSFRPSAADPENYGFDAIARLREGFALSHARDEGERITAALAADFPGTKTGIGATAYPLRYADVPTALAIASLVLLATTSLVMLIACTNVSMMLLARGEERREEMVVRSALGASRGRLARQLLAESTVLAGLGAVGAVALVVMAGRVFPLLLPPEHPFWVHFGLDGRVLGWCLLAAFVSSLAMGLLPAVRVSRAEGKLGPGSGSRVITGQGRFVVGGQVAMASLLVLMAGLSMRALADLRAVDPGFETDGRVAQGLTIPPWEYPDAPDRMIQLSRIMDRLSRLSGVRAVGLGETLPFFEAGDQVAVQAVGSSQASNLVAVLNNIGGDYFGALGIPILRGRSPTPYELREGAAVAVLSQGMAERLWPGENPIGQRIRHSPRGSRNPVVGPDQPALEIVGVAGDVHQDGPGRSVQEQFYLPMGPGAPATSGLVVYFGETTSSQGSLIRDRVAEVNPGLIIFGQMELDEATDWVLWAERQTTLLLAGFALLALTLALTGVFGVVAYRTRRKEREIGVRMALGASRVSIRWSVLADTLFLVVPGLLIGFGGAICVAILARSALPWVPVWDPTTLLGTGALFLIVALLAGLLPAHRATQSDPVRTLA